MIELPRLAADVYARDALAWVLGPTYHPGGLALTNQLAMRMDLPGGARVLDVASGPGASARHLTESFGWRVVGVDATLASASRPRAAAIGSVPFVTGDANRLPFHARVFDGAICECSLCLFGEEAAAMREVVRVVRPGARVGLSDVTLAGDAPSSPAMRSTLAAVACIATAKPVDGYRQVLERAGVRVDGIEDASWALRDLLASVRTLGERASELGLDDVRIGGYTVGAIRRLVDEAWDLHRGGHLGYSILVGTVPQ